MNTELVEQIAKDQGIPWDDKYNWYVSNADLKRFAELIIKKCIEIDIENPDARPGLEIANYFGMDL